MKNTNITINALNRQVGVRQSLPDNYKQGKNPLIIFLHGIGERGYGTPAELDYMAGLEGTPPWYAVKGDITVGNDSFIILSPQLPKDQGGWVNEITDEVYKLALTLGDPSRIYLTGLSLGGGGVVQYLVEPGNAEKFAAAAAVCPTDYWDKNKVANIIKAKLPIFWFVGLADTIVTPWPAQNGYALTKGVADTRLKEYPGIAHDAWRYAYTLDHSQQNPNVWEWFLQHRRGISATVTSGGGVLNEALGDVLLKDDNLVLAGDGTPVIGLDLPVADAGKDQTVGLQPNGQPWSFVLSGKGSKGTGLKYLWSKISGGNAYIVSPTAQETYVNSVVPGTTYVFRLTVSNATQSAFDNITVTVDGVKPVKTLTGYNVVEVFSDGSKGVEKFVDKSKVQM